ncbi:MAG: hypothetical protein ABIP54_01420 [Candidatus Andersenbacteria bacterium]
MRHRIVFGCIWWALFLGPILLFPNDFRSRWLTLSVFGIGLILATLAQAFEHRWPKASKALFPLFIIIIVIYGFMTMRFSTETRYYREQAEYVQQAYTQLQQQEKHVATEKRIVLAGVIEEQISSVSAYLFRLYAKNPQAEIIYLATPPTEQLPTDIIINMSGIRPYDAGRVL